MDSRPKSTHRIANDGRPQRLRKPFRAGGAAGDEGSTRAETAAGAEEAAPAGGAAEVEGLAGVEHAPQAADAEESGDITVGRSDCVGLLPIEMPSTPYSLAIVAALALVRLSRVAARHGTRHATEQCLIIGQRERREGPRVQLRQSSVCAGKDLASAALPLIARAALHANGPWLDKKSSCVWPPPRNRRQFVPASTAIPTHAH